MFAAWLFQRPIVQQLLYMCTLVSVAGAGAAGGALILAASAYNPPAAEGMS